LSQFGSKAALGILIVNGLAFLFFRRELRGLGPRGAPGPEGNAAVASVPTWVIAVNLGFMAWTVANAHYPPLFIGGFLFFLGFAQATSAHQGALDLKAPLLVGFFLASLVVHGGLQGWWIAPILARLNTIPLFFGAAFLTAFNDNALVTYLATLVPSLSEAAKHAIVAGAAAGGGGGPGRGRPPSPRRAGPPPPLPCTHPPPGRRAPGRAPPPP